MNSLKTVTLVAVMAAVAYGVYASLNKRPAAPPPVDMPSGFDPNSMVQMPGPAGGSPLPPPTTTGAVPNFVAPAPAAAMPAALPAAATNPPPSPFESAAAPGPAQALLPAASAPATATMPATPEGGFAVAADDQVRTASTGPQDAPLDMHAQFKEAMSIAYKQLEAGRIAETHVELSLWHGDPRLSAADQKELVDLLDRLAGTVLYSHRHHLLAPAYQVQPGETLESIAKKHNLSWQLLAKINGIDPSGAVRHGDVLKVFKGPFYGVVDLQQMMLTLFLEDGRYAGRFPIGLGKEMPTNGGDFEVVSIVANPSYRAGDRAINPGDPTNPYGKYWVDLGNRVGIHGTNDPRNVGRNDAPAGCICVGQQDIEYVVDMLAAGSKVTIRK